MMLQNKGGIQPPAGGYAIVNMGSKGAVDGLPKATSYTAAKHAVLGITRVISKDYATDNIRANCLCPGLIWTDLLKNLLANAHDGMTEESVLQRCYTKRFGTAEEMANIVNFLLGPESSYITGQAIEADGSWAP